MKRKMIAAASIAAFLSVGLAACGGSGGSANDAESQKFEGRGPITYVQGKDNSGKLQGLIDKWNEKHPDEKVTLIELSTEADQQRQSMIQNAQTKSDAYCVEGLDVVWVAEFAANRWVMQLPQDQFPKNEMLPAVWKTGEYRNNLYAVPYASDGGMLYARTDLLKQAGINEIPKSWDEMHKACDAVRALPGQKDIGCYAGQFAKYEGLTVNFDEAVHSFGGAIVENGKVVVDSKESKDALNTLDEGFKSGFIPKEALTYKEEEGRAAFEAGRLLFYRNWPYQYSLTEKTMKGKFEVAPLPSFVAGKPGISSLGGHNAAISTFCKNKATALDFVKWFTNQESAQYMLSEMSNAPAYADLYTKEENVKAYPYLPILLKSVQNAVPRPQVVNYGDVTAAIQDNVYPSLQGQVPADKAITDLSKKLKEVVKE